ncbi:MAG: hypothetical protein H7A25_23140 [Leptospiraceae bacterium]|nr:hypothetical protein [Leptospiraceae bacterium]MCP5502814.1 hypothetical protein [Leptospiraceae bacterium]
MDNKPAPRRFNSEIIINETGKWIFRNNEIKQDKVLNFFKQNMQEDEEGIYILNRYGNFTEIGYLTCKHYPFYIHNYANTSQGLYFEADNGTQFSLDELNLFLDEKGELFCQKKKEKFLKYRFDRNTSTFLSGFLEEKGEEIELKYKENVYPIQNFPFTFDVKVPQAYSQNLKENSLPGLSGENSSDRK